MTNRVTGTLIRPLDQQADRDGMVIDPAGVDFDPDAWYSIVHEFNHSEPPIGRAKVVREPDGSLTVHGELFTTTIAGKFAFGGMTDEVDAAQSRSVVQKASLLEIGLTANHTDPDQPEIQAEENQ